MNKVVFITGASSGFGEATARKFASSGYTLILGARRLDKLTTLAQELENKCQIYCAELDVTCTKSVERFFSNLPPAFSQIDVLVNNAGLSLGLDPAFLADMSDWETMIETNITGLTRITQKLLPSMVARNTGHIINIGSVAGNWPYPGGNVYGATKSFVQHFSRSLRADLFGKNIRVTNIEPGLAETNFSNVRFKGDEEKAQKVYNGTKPLTPGDIADIIYWVNSVPAHVNINSIEVMPICQTWGALPIYRDNE